MRLFLGQKYPGWPIPMNGSQVHHWRANQEKQQQQKRSSIWQATPHLNPFVIRPSRPTTSMPNTPSKRLNKRSLSFRKISIRMHPFRWNSSWPITRGCRKEISPVRHPSLNCVRQKKICFFAIVVLVATTTAFGCAMVPLPLNLPILAFVTVGTMLTSASANTINQLMEIPYDAQMKRTRNRVLVLGQMRFVINDSAFFPERNIFSFQLAIDMPLVLPVSHWSQVSLCSP